MSNSSFIVAMIIIALICIVVVGQSYSNEMKCQDHAPLSKSKGHENYGGSTFLKCDNMTHYIYVGQDEVIEVEK